MTWNPEPHSLRAILWRRGAVMKSMRTKMKRNHLGRETEGIEVSRERGEEAGAEREKGAGVGAGKGGREGEVEVGTEEAEVEGIEVRSGAGRERER